MIFSCFYVIFRGHVHQSEKSDNPELAISAAFQIIGLSLLQLGKYN